MHRELVTKIEGHADLHIDWEGNNVVVEVVESERLFEGMLVGRPVEELAWITPRICGICSTSHTLASLCAIEKTLGLDLKPETILMRKLMLNSQIIQSHPVHLYYLVLPDYLGLDSGLDLKAKYPKYFDIVSEIKEVYDDLTHTIGGRRLLPTTTKIDSPANLPPIKKLEDLKKRMVKSIPLIEKTINIFGALDYPKLDFEMFYASQINGSEYCVYGGKYIKAVDKKRMAVYGNKSAIADYRDIIEEKAKDVPAKYGYVSGKPAMVGALARLAVQGQFIKDKEVLRHLKKYPLNFESPFYNNSAQAIEMLLLANESVFILDKLIKMTASNKKFQSKISSQEIKRRGLGAVEAPRGGLYHEIVVDEKGIIEEVNIITPTVQNLSSLETTAQSLIKQTTSLSKNKRKHLLEMLIRSYDPCLTCAVH